VWGLLIRDYLGPDRTFDLGMRYGVFIPMLVLSLAVSYTRAYERFWHHACTALILITGLGLDGVFVGARHDRRATSAPSA
jgi:hypothetical protein